MQNKRVSVEDSKYILHEILFYGRGWAVLVNLSTLFGRPNLFVLHELIYTGTWQHFSGLVKPLIQVIVLTMTLIWQVFYKPLSRYLSNLLVRYQKFTHKKMRRSLHNLNIEKPTKIELLSARLPTRHIVRQRIL